MMSCSQRRFLPMLFCNPFMPFPCLSILLFKFSLEKADQDVTAMSKPFTVQSINLTHRIINVYQTCPCSISVQCFHPRRYYTGLDKDDPQTRYGQDQDQVSSDSSVIV